MDKLHHHSRAFDHWNEKWPPNWISIGFCSVDDFQQINPEIWKYTSCLSLVKGKILTWLPIKNTEFPISHAPPFC